MQLSHFFTATKTCPTNHTTWSLVDCHFPLGVASKTRLIYLSLGIRVMWPKHCRRDLPIWKSGSTLKVLQILHQCILLLIATKFLQKSHLWCLYLRLCSFSHTPRFMTIVQDWNKDLFKNSQLCGVWKMFCDHKAIKLFCYHVVLHCPIHWPPHGVHDLTFWVMRQLNDCSLFNTCLKI